MKKKYLTLCSACNDSVLALDDCKNMVELEATFADAYKHYVGRKPTRRTIDKFLREKFVSAINGYIYQFSY